MSFTKLSIEKAIADFGHVGQLRHLGETMDGDEVFDSLTLFGVTVKIDKDELLNMLKAKEPPADEWRGVEVEEKEVEPEVEVEEEPVEAE
tara:strand:+ start:1921 stop:2190 length:270 start_codon:yes stop_codon:yes gene_type:complete